MHQAQAVRAVTVTAIIVTAVIAMAIIAIVEAATAITTKVQTVSITVLDSKIS